MLSEVFPSPARSPAAPSLSRSATLWKNHHLQFIHHRSIRWSEHRDSHRAAVAAPLSTDNTRSDRPSCCRRHSAAAPIVSPRRRGADRRRTDRCTAIGTIAVAAISPSAVTAIGPRHGRRSHRGIALSGPNPTSPSIIGLGGVALSPVSSLTNFSKMSKMEHRWDGGGSGVLCSFQTVRRERWKLWQPWKYDTSIEYSFFVTVDALERVEPHLRLDEQGFLGAFDANRDLICQTAAEVHSRDRKSCFELVGADFRLVQGRSKFD